MVIALVKKIFCHFVIISFQQLFFDFSQMRWSEAWKRNMISHGKFLRTQKTVCQVASNQHSTMCISKVISYVNEILIIIL